ncbi:hypothetical protein [Ferrimonas senticii]|uniref:hypothetical protein n=1 Tax=Ferrimonas senticii TaxID=394566 RepID=UPI0004854F66|nr:hypothetical protein [Ferrimonas senticii]
MSRSHIRKHNRSHNAGSPPPDYTHVMHSLRRMNKDLSPEEMVVWLILWLQNRLSNDLTEEQLLQFVKVRNNVTPCADGQVRTSFDGTVSWTEFSHGVHRDGIDYIWLPLPEAIHVFCHKIISKLRNGQPLLSARQATHLLTKIRARQRHRGSSSTQFKLARKSVLNAFWLNLARSDGRFNVVSFTVLFGSDKLHHRHAIHYQREDISRCRHQILELYNRGFHNISEAAVKAGVEYQFLFTMDGKRLQNRTTPSAPKHHKQYKDRIFAIKRTPTVEEIPDAIIGGKRAIDLSIVPAIFSAINASVKQLKPTKRGSKRQHQGYFNARTMQLALQTIALSGMRPTNQVSPSAASWHRPMASVSDKGELRPLYINRFLADRIDQYLQLQQQVLPPNHTDNHRPLLMLVDDLGQPTPLTSKALRAYLRQFSDAIVPYQLRHACAQGLQELGESKQLIAKVMGHYHDGEQYDVSWHTPDSRQRIITALDSLTSHLGVC